MTYHSHTKKELSFIGIQEEELAIYTGTANPLSLGTLSPDCPGRNAYVYRWRNGTYEELCGCFFRSSANGLDLLEVGSDEELYSFLRDKQTGYIRQVSGPAKPVVLVNLGAVPLRVDTFLGKFEVQAGSALRLDEHAPKRTPRNILLTFVPSERQPLKRATLWDGQNWQSLNICATPHAPGEDPGFVVRDGNTVVQYLTVCGTTVHMASSPEPDPDYCIYITGDEVNTVTLEFDRREYRCGLPLPVRRTLSLWGDTKIFDLARVQCASTDKELYQSTVDLAELTADKPGPALNVDLEEANSSSPLLALARSLRDNVPLLPAEPPENFPT